VTAAGLDVRLGDGSTFWWPLAEVRQTQGAYAGEQVRLERGGPFPDILLADDPAFLDALRAAAPRFAHGLHVSRRRWLGVPLAILAALASAAILAVLYVWGIPAAAGALAARVPVAWEERLGQVAVAQLAPPQSRCVDPEREAAIATIVARLLAPLPRVSYTFRVAVVDHPAVNALAAPGGTIVLLRGLLEQTRTPEELAGVLAHEMQHILRRHTTQMLLQHVSTGLVLAAISGDVSGVTPYGLESARALGALRYSRGKEQEADVEGLRMLLAAEVDPGGMISFFETLQAEERKMPTAPGYLLSHPPAASRTKTLRRLAATLPHRSKPLLPGRDWHDVTRICTGGRR
jgi:predicted Zn-dependent protease